MRGYLARAAFAAAVVMLLAMPASAASCNAVAEVRRQVAKLMPGAAMTEMGRDETQGFLRAFNAEPPVSSETGDYALVIDDPTRAQIAVVLFERGCAARTGYLPRGVFSRLMRSL